MPLERYEKAFGWSRPARRQIPRATRAVRFCWKINGVRVLPETPDVADSKEKGHARERAFDLALRLCSFDKSQAGVHNNSDRERVLGAPESQRMASCPISPLSAGTVLIPSLLS